MADSVKKYFCPRLLDYVIFVGPRASETPDNQTSPSLGNHSRVPHLLRRYPPQDHQDFALPPDVVIFCQPEGCDRLEANVNQAYGNPSTTTNSFVFLLTEKDTSRVRYGICLNFYRPLQKCSSSKRPKQQSTNTEQVNAKAFGDDDNNNKLDINNNNFNNDNKFDDTYSQRTNSTQDNESGVRVSTGPDSDSVGSATTASHSDFQCKSTAFKQHHQHHNNHHHHHHSKHKQIKANPTIGRKFNTTTSSTTASAAAASTKDKTRLTYALNSICIISHHPFFSTFRECLFIMRKFIQACEDKDLSYMLELSNKQYPCNCHLKQTPTRVRRGSQYSHQSQASRRSMANNLHCRSCPYSNPIWSLLTMPDIEESLMSTNHLNDVSEIEAWILRFLSLPVPVPEKTKIEVEVMSPLLKQPLLFALPDHTRFSLIDFPLHLPLELLGVETCLQVLTCILLEHKVALQSKDYNALSMSVMAFVTMIYPLEYMFPVIPLLPSCMSSAEQLLLAPTPYIIGFPSSFFKFKYNFTLPNDVWIVDLDTNKVKKPPNVEDLPPLPDHEGSILVQNLQKILNSMSGANTVLPGGASASQSGNLTQNTLRPHPSRQVTTITRGGAGVADEGQSSMPSSPFKRRSSIAAAGQLLQFAANKLSGNSTPTATSNLGSNSALGTQHQSPESTSGRSSFAAPAVTPSFNPLAIINNDTDEVDVAVRIAMVRFFNSQEVLANFVEHTRTIRLYPRPVVSFQKSSFIQSRTKISPFLTRLVETQAVEYMAEWALCPDNVAFQRIQTGVYDPATIGDKPKWYGNQLDPLKYQIWDEKKKEFYEEVATLIKDASSVSGTASSTGKISDYYEEDEGKEGEEDRVSELDAENVSTTSTRDGQDAMAHDINNNNINLIGDELHSAYVSSNDSSPCYSSDGEEITETNWPVSDRPLVYEGRVLTLNDVMNMRLKRSSISSSMSSNDSYGNNQVMQSIPANYQHDLGRFPPVRCDISKHYKPFSTLVHSRYEAERLCGGAMTCDDGPASEPKERLEVIDSSDDDENDSSKNQPDSSSCDESGTEEFDFNSIQPTTTADVQPIVRDPKLFESVDSDTIVSNVHAEALSIDENNNVKTITSSSETNPINGSMDNISMASSSVEAPLTNQQQDFDKTAAHDDNQSSKPQGPISDTMSAIISSQKARMSSGVAKLIDRASSIGQDAKILRQGSQGSGSLSPLPKSEQVGAFFDRVTSEARDAVKEAKAALDVGKDVLKTKAIPVADAGRQKLLKNLQNIGENLFEERRDSSATTTRGSIDSTSMQDSGHLLNNNSQDNVRQATTQQSGTSKTSELNEIAGKANSMISGWLGSKATGFANRMRAGARPLGPFPTSKYDACFCYIHVM